MRLVSVHTYPVKSCRRIDHGATPVLVERWGLAGDRRWLVVDPEGRSVTQREVPVMTQVRPETAPDGGLRLTAPGEPELVVPEPAPVPADLRQVFVHRTPVLASPAGADADDWLSTVLDRNVRLVWLDDPGRRSVEVGWSEPADRVGFADAYPVLLANTASLAGLNDWLAEAGGDEGPLPMTRFRPNLVVEGAPAWAEDGWLGHRLRVGPVTFRVAKPCDRCVMTTTDQETGEKGREPLRTLARYRTVDQKVLFGVNLIPDPPFGAVAAGDPVTLVP